jgi:hypothetical protein
MNDNTSSLINLPCQLTPLDTPQTDDELAAEMRIRLTRHLNQVTAGQRLLTEDLKNSIRNMNAIFHRSGYPLIDVNF